MTAPSALGLLMLAAASGLPAEAARHSRQSPSSREESSPAAGAESAPGPAFILESPPDAPGGDAAAYERGLEQHGEECIQQVLAASPGSGQASAVLRCVEFLLDQRCEPALSRVMLGIAAPRDGDALAAAAGQALELCAQLESAPAADRPPDAALLKAVAQVVAAMGRWAQAPDAPDQAARDGLLAGGLEIASFLDDPRPAVAGLARLFQAACYRRAGRAGRAIEVLGATDEARGATSEAPGVYPYEVFAGTEHARALLDQGNFVAAAALSLKLEAGAAVRVPIEHRTAAAHTFRGLRLSIMRGWAEHLRKQPDAAGADRAEAHARRLARSFNAAGAVPLYRFGRVMPEKQAP